ncbi:hypothetical protein [Sodalis-like endosymbiont of Proechinophthirus fluctus]
MLVDLIIDLDEVERTETQRQRCYLIIGLLTAQAFQTFSIGHESHTLT